MSVPNSLGMAFSGIRESGVPVDGVGRAIMNGWILATSFSVIEFDDNVRRHPRLSVEINQQHDLT